MESVLHQCDRVSANFDADPVHDLRVALRRCRSMTDGLMALDPHPEWKAMKKAGKRLFQRLGELRDVQIMMDWIEKLEPKLPRVARGSSSASSSSAGESSAEQPILQTQATQVPPKSEEQENLADPPAQALLEILKQRETEQKREAKAALEEFDRKQWQKWTRSLPARAAHIRPGSVVFKHLALERWLAARELHNRALRHRSPTAWHNLRIGIKRFRYIVENFLPEEHALWARDLKQMQDALGDVHDFDVLWDTLLSSDVFADQASRQRWQTVITEERDRRIELYRERMVGPESLWHVWRARLPQGRQIEQIALRRMKLWAKALDPDFAHSERVSRLALELYDGLQRAHLLSPTDGTDLRRSLQLAALLHDVGKSTGKKGHHKESFRLIQGYGTIPGWKAEDVERAAVIARFHEGVLPSRSHILMRDRLPNDQKAVVQMSGILRLANAFDAAHNGQIRAVSVEAPARNGRPHGNGYVVISAEGYSSRSETAQAVAAERHLLELVLRRPVLVKAGSGEHTRLRSRA